MEFKHKTLSNGLTIVGEINKSALSAAVGFFVRAGSRDETSEISGVSHFLEHMMFKGTDKLSALEVNETFDRLGAQYNAFTSEENTVYYAAVLPEYLAEVTDLWTELMRPSLRTEDFDIEKNVIKEEIAMYKDLPQFDVMDRCKTMHFKDHPCGNTVLGTEESIAALKAGQMRNYFQNRYAPNNMVLACCGNFDFDALCALAESKCGNWTPSEVKRQLSHYAGSKVKNREEKANLVREHICLMSPAVSMQDDRRFAASLLSMIVGDYTGSRYFWALVDPAIAETAAMQFESMDGVGAIYSYIRCDSSNVPKVMSIIEDIFKKLTANGITADELQKAGNKVLSALTIKCEQPMGRLTNLGFNWVYLQQYRSMADDMAAVKAVTVEDVNAIIAEFDPGDFTQLSIGPPAD
ncbi:MAG: M16 family metallopeptidase [Planctomycetota bacterium]|jgi:predicted Zn-dependent peptidase